MTWLSPSQRSTPVIDVAEPAVAITIRPGPSDVDPAGFMRRRRRQNRILGITTPVVLLILWQVCSQAGVIDDRFFPAPTTIASTAREMIADGTLQEDILVTLRVWIIGFLAGFAIGTATGALLGLSRIVRAAFEPVLSSLYTIPKLAILPLLLMIFGLGDTPKIFLVALGVFFISWISTLEAVLDIPEGYLETARSFHVGRIRTLRKVVVPAILPQIFVGMRIAVGNSILILIGIEFVSAKSGIGFRIWNSWTIFAADRMYVGIIVVALLGFLLTNVVKLLARICVPWAPRALSNRA
jgi:ABC-type nitrate/sulfonate/bicarbonate transport system permease component